MRTIAIAAALACSGCAFHIGPIDAALMGSYYTHREEFSPGEDAELAAWNTAIGRTWGTVDVEAKIDESSERVASTGDGMSENMAGVLGDDLGKVVAHEVACALQPLSAGCITSSDGAEE